MLGSVFFIRSFINFYILSPNKAHMNARIGSEQDQKKIKQRFIWNICYADLQEHTFIDTLTEIANPSQIDHGYYRYPPAALCNYN